MSTQSHLASWNDGPAKQAITSFVAEVTAQCGKGFVPPEERIATFDNDGTLWCEKPMPIELEFILERFVAMAEQDATLRDRQPWKAAYEKDYSWLSGGVTKHYQGEEPSIAHGQQDLPAVVSAERMFAPYQWCCRYVGSPAEFASHPVMALIPAFNVTNVDGFT